MRHDQAEARVVSRPEWLQAAATRLLALLLLAPAFAQATAIFDGYEAYYVTRDGRLFREPGVDVASFFTEGEEGAKHVWQGLAGGRRQRIELRNGMVRINGQRLQLSKIFPFPGESFSTEDLGLGTTVYATKGWFCLENTPLAASGTAVRHQMVYLIRKGQQGYEAWILPSMFARCQGVRMVGKTILVDAAKLVYEPGADFATSVRVKEYAIKGHTFVPTGAGWSGTFVEPENVYKFSIDTK
jgi:hypothetical protein